MKTVSCKSPFRNVLLRSMWCISHCLVTAMVRIIWIVDALTTGLKESKKSTPSVC